MVDLEGSLHGAAHLADLGEEALNNFAPQPVVHLLRVVANECVLVPRQGDAAEHRHQRLFAIASLLLDDQSLHGMATIVDRRLQSTSDLAELRLVLVGQRRGRVSKVVKNRMRRNLRMHQPT